MISIVGTWRLVRAEAFDANGKPLPAPYGGAPVGRVMFTSGGRMMAMTGDGRQEVLDDQVREYNTYAGTYTFNGERLITRVDSCSNPAYMGTEQVRDVGHEGGLMVLRPPVRAYVGRPPEQRVLYWKRISDDDA
jgi:Lipocalin-like domain